MGSLLWLGYLLAMHVDVPAATWKIAEMVRNSSGAGNPSFGEIIMAHAPPTTRAMRRRATHVNKALHGTAIQKGIRSDVCLLPRRSLLCLRLLHSYTTLEMYSMRAMCRRERIASIKRVILPVVPRLPKAPPRILPSSAPSCGRSFHST